MAAKTSRSSGRPGPRSTDAKPVRDHRPRERVPAPIVPGSVPEGAAVAKPVLETPHGHLICHRCGRISELELTELDRHLLEQISERRPKEWGLDGVTFSLTGTCPRCRKASH